MRARRSAASVVAIRIDSVCELLVDRQFPLRETLGDALTRSSVAICRVPSGARTSHMLPNSSDDRTAIVVDVDDVRASLASLLPRPDIHGGHAEIGALANRHARVPDDALRMDEHAEKVLRIHVPEQVQVRRMLPLAEHANTLGRAVRTGVGIRPEPER